MTSRCSEDAFTLEDELVTVNEDSSQALGQGKQLVHAEVQLQITLSWRRIILRQGNIVDCRPGVVDQEY
jgi:hypothetical protein